jgi:hypothetical protein
VLISGWRVIMGFKYKTPILFSLFDFLLTSLLNYCSLELNTIPS